MPDMWKIYRDRQARSLGLYAWRTDRTEMGDVGGHGRQKEVEEEGERRGGGRFGGDFFL